LVGRELSSHVTQAGRDGHEVTVVKLVIGKDPLATNSTTRARSRLILR
jgi:hypothetical protein